MFGALVVEGQRQRIIIIVEERRSVRRRCNSNVAQQHSARERNKEVLLRRRDGERGESDEGWGEQNESESVLGISGVERGRRRVPRGDAVGDGENNCDGVGENGTTRRGREAKGETLRPREYGHRRVSRLTAVAERHLSPDRFDGLGGRRGGENQQRSDRKRPRERRRGRVHSHLPAKYRRV